MTKPAISRVAVHQHQHHITSRKTLDGSAYRLFAQHGRVGGCNQLVAPVATKTKPRRHVFLGSRFRSLVGCHRVRGIHGANAGADAKTADGRPSTTPCTRGVNLKHRCIFLNREKNEQGCAYLSCRGASVEFERVHCAAQVSDTKWKNA